MLRVVMHIEQTAGEIFIYTEGGCYADKPHYLGKCLYRKITDESAHLHTMLCPGITKHLDELYDKLKELGFKRIVASLPTDFKPDGFVKCYDFYVREL